MRINHRLVLAILLVVFGTVMRVLPHPWGLTPIGAVALFSGACFDRKRWSFVIPLVALFISDTVLEVFTGNGFHSLMPVIYGAFAAIVGMGMLLGDRRQSVIAVGSGAFAGATFFYIVSNFAMWAISDVYPKTAQGLITCYIAGIPYYGTGLFADLLYSALLFGTFVWAERRLPRFAAA
jgi:hypothetical protein